MATDKITETEEREIAAKYAAASAILSECAAGACGQPGDRKAEVRFSAGDIRQCHSDCYNRQVYARRAADAARSEIIKAAGRRYWDARGIVVGQELMAFQGDMLTGGLLGGGMARGKACASGTHGAYVRSKAQRGYLAPGSWRVIEKAAEAVA